MNAMRESFVFYKTFFDSVKALDDADYVEITKAFFDHVFYDARINLPPLKAGYLTLIMSGVERATARYTASVENGKKGGEHGKKGSEHGAKGGRPRKEKAMYDGKNNPPKTPLGIEKNPLITPLNDNVNDNVNDNEKTMRLAPCFSSIVVDEHFILSQEEYDAIAERFNESPWLRDNITHLSKIHTHRDKILSGYYKSFVKGNPLSKLEQERREFVRPDLTPEELDEMFPDIDDEDL